MSKLTIERLFSEPDLNGIVPLAVKFSADGSQVTWLRGADDDIEKLDLWCYDIEADESRLLVDADQLQLLPESLSDEEKARRERRRISHRGIVEYCWHPDSKHLLFPLDGDLYLYNTQTTGLVQLTTADTFETDVRFSPDGRHISFIRDRNLFVMDVEGQNVKPLTHDGGDTVSNGLPEFIAQEEMHRYEGYWWSPDSSRIAYIRVDEGPVEVTQRYEIDADSFRVFDQRYPFAGTPNAETRLGVVDLEGETTWIDTPREQDSYLARVSWLFDSARLAVQVQSRDQRTLSLVLSAADNAQHRQVLEETSATWINLHDHFRALKEQDAFIWGSERSGYMHLYLVSTDGKRQTAITRGDWAVNRVVRIDEASDIVWFEGSMESPLERHLYRVPIDGSTAPERITREGCFHQTELAPDGRHIVDRYSATRLPNSVDLTDASGERRAMLSKNELDEAHPFFPYLHCRGELETGTLTAEDGQALHFGLVRPASNATPFPVIVAVYGGPGAQRVTNQWLPPWQHYMASRGYGIFNLDNRGSANRGVAFEAPIHGQLGVAEVADQLLGVEYLKSRADVDGERLGVFGHSYGGFMTLMLMSKAPGTFRAGVSVAPVTDWRLYDTHYTERYLGHPDEDPEAYEASSVFPYIRNIRGRLLLVHGMADDNVLFTNTTRLMKVLQDHNVQFDLMTYPGAKHGISGKSNNIHRYTLMDDFFDRWLLASD